MFPLTTRQAANAGAIAGAAIVLLTTLPLLLTGDVAAGLGVLAFTAWALVPYIVLWAVGPRLPWPSAVLGAGACAVAFEIGIRLSVFVFPRGSTAAIALVFSPGVALLLAMPAGAVAGRLIGRTWTRGPRLLRLPALLVAIGGPALLVLGLARPDLFPTTVYTRRRALERIGAPGVRLGADRFAVEPVSPDDGWYLAGDFDGRPGEEVAVVHGDRLQIFDIPQLTPREPQPLAGEAARWNWFSTLAWSDGALRRVDIGGGFQETQVFDLDGTRRFRYHPDPQLPPSALRPADLDGDGDAEFYAASTHGLSRLDGGGRERWTRPAPSADIVGLHPETSLAPAWLVTRVYGQPVTIWSPQGETLATVAADPAGTRQLIGVFEWRETRLIAAGGDRLTLYAVDGSSRFEWTVADMRVVGAWRLQPVEGEAPLLAIQAVADRDTHRARLQVIDADGALVYDEVSEEMPRVLTARAADGTTVLLVSPNGHSRGLYAFRPRR